MEGNQAYSPVTQTMTTDGENGMAQDGGRPKQGARTLRCRKIILGAIAVVVLIILLIIIIVFASKRSKGSPAPNNTTFTTTVAHVTTKMVTTLPATSTTLGPPGFFTGKIVINETYNNAFDDDFSPEYRQLRDGFIAGMNEHFRPYQEYSGTQVVSLVINDLGGTRSPAVTEVNFRTTVVHIGKGLPESLNDISSMGQYTVLSTEVSPEQTNV